MLGSLLDDRPNIKEVKVGQKPKLEGQIHEEEDARMVISLVIQTSRKKGRRACSGAFSRPVAYGIIR